MSAALHFEPAPDDGDGYAVPLDFDLMSDDQATRAMSWEAFLAQQKIAERAQEQQALDAAARRDIEARRVADAIAERESERRLAEERQAASLAQERMRLAATLERDRIEHLTTTQARRRMLTALVIIALGVAGYRLATGGLPLPFDDRPMTAGD